MRAWTLKTKLTCLLAVALLMFLTYLFLRVKFAIGAPVVHTLWSRELASLVRTIARSVQLLGLLAGTTTLIAAAKNWKTKQPFMFARVAQAAILCGLSLVTPDLAAQCIPVLFGLVLDF